MTQLGFLGTKLYIYLPLVHENDEVRGIRHDPVSYERKRRQGGGADGIRQNKLPAPEARFLDRKRDLNHVSRSEKRFRSMPVQHFWESIVRSGDSETLLMKQTVQWECWPDDVSIHQTSAQ